MTKNYKSVSNLYLIAFLTVSICGVMLVNPFNVYSQGVGVGSVVPQSKSTITTTISPLVQDITNNATAITNNATDKNNYSLIQNTTTQKLSNIDEKEEKETKQFDSKKLISKVSDAITEKWWTWALSYNATSSPITDTSGERCVEGDVEKDMFYLASATEGQITRSCEISDKQEVLIPILTAFCYSGGTCLTEQVVNDTKQVEEETVKALDSASSIEATLDGNPLNLEKARVTTAPFKVKATSDNPYGISEGKYEIVADGFFVLLKPLSEGTHILNFKGSLSQFNYNPEVTYNLTVVKNN